MKKITVIIPLYDAENYIRETLISLISQTYSHWECLIFDDGSSDNSFEIAKEISRNENRITVEKRPDFVTKGPSGIRNYGLQISNTEFVNFLDADDVIHKDKFKKLVDELELHPNKIACISRSYHFKDTIDNLTRPWKEGDINENLLNTFAQSKAGWQTGDPIWRRKFLPKEMFDKRLFGPDDWIAHISLLLRYKYEDFIFIDDVLSYIRVLPVSLHTEPSKRRLKSDILSRDLVMKWYKDTNVSDETTKKLINDLLKSSEEALVFGHLKIGVNGITIASKQLFKLGVFVKPFQLFFLGLPSMYFFKKGYKYFRF